MHKYFLFIIILGLFCSCKEEAIQPKPKAFLALNYEDAKYDLIDLECPYQFKKNSEAEILPSKSNRKCWLNISYPKQKATLFITYNQIEDNLNELLKDAQKLPLQHSVKADEIEANLFENSTTNTYGTFYEVKGDAASQAQFYATDSIKHFLTGSIYFDARPNYDSILPAAEYIKKDIRKIMETLEWEN